MSGLDLAVSFLLTLGLHATVLLGAVWLAERAGWLRHIGWAELAWRTALFGALLSATLATCLPLLTQAATSASFASAAPVSDEAPRPRQTVGADLPVQIPAAGKNAAGADAYAARHPANAAPGGPRRSGDRVAVSSGFALALLALWLLGMALGLGRLAMQAVALHRLGRAARTNGTPAPDRLVQQAHRLAGELGIPAPTLRVSPHAASPMVLPGASVLLPEWASSLDARQQRAMLAHELSHLQRRDPAWRIAQRLAALPLFFHPLAHHARRRLDALAEDACDAGAAQLMGSGRPLAECLATCLSHAGARAGQPALAVAMAGDAGAVVRRVSNLLENTAMSLRPLSPRLRRTALVLAIVAIVALPGVAITTVASEGFGDRISSRLGLDGRQSHSYNSRSLAAKESLRLSGDVTLNDADTNVMRLGKGARLEIEQSRDGVDRKLHVFGKDGVIQRRYWREGDERPFDDEARQWLATALPGMIRNSGINADARGKRILAKGGADALLADMATLQTDHARANYLRVLYANASLDDMQLDRSLGIARDIDSDFELRQALQSALSSQRLAPAHRVHLLGLASEFSSDFELAELLMSLAEGLPAAGPEHDAWRTALSGISSDFEHRRVLEAVLRRSNPAPAAVQMVLESAAGISSDFELRNVLERSARHTRGNPAVLAAYAARTAGMSSDFEARQALVALMDAGPVDRAVANTVLDAVGGVSSDFEASEVLKSLAKAMPADPALIESYRAAARRLGDFERGQAEKALDRFVAAGP